jgi:oligogalacturonide lyase
MEVWPLLPTRRLLQQCGHECFTSRGTVVTQYAEREHVRQEPSRHANVTMKPDGSDVRYFWYDCFQPGHVQTSHGDESLLVGDCGPRKDVHDAEGAAWLSLVRLADGRSRLTPLCRHGSSWKTQSSHPHPVFFLDDRWVLFSSDRGGRENVYRVQLRVES